jgi:hypothetical protein
LRIKRKGKVLYTLNNKLGCCIFGHHKSAVFIYEQKKGNLHMSNIASTVKEIELADVQLKTIFGADDYGYSNNTSSPESDSSPQINSSPSPASTHLAVSTAFHESFKFSFDISIEIEEDMTEILKDCD